MLISIGGSSVVCVLDLETRPDPQACGLLSTKKRAAAEWSIGLQEIVAASVFQIRRNGQSGWTDPQLRSWSIEEMSERTILQGISGCLAQLSRQDGSLITFNGKHHDLPILRKRVLANWMFDAHGIQVWTTGPQPTHIDLMSAPQTSSGVRRQSLRETVAGLYIGLPSGPNIDRQLGPGYPTYKSQVDVLATFLLLLHELAFAEGGIAPLETGWVAAADYLNRDWLSAKHLHAFTRNSRLKILRDHIGHGTSRGRGTS
jgi:hypothetical protein